MKDQKPLNVEEAAAFLDLSVSHLYSLTSKGKIRHYKPSGKRLYFMREDLLDYIRGGRVSTEEEIEQQAADYMVK